MRARRSLARARRAEFGRARALKDRRVGRRPGLGAKLASRARGGVSHAALTGARDAPADKGRHADILFYVTLTSDKFASR